MWSHAYSPVICVYLHVYVLRGCVPAEELELCHAEDTAPYKEKSCWRIRLSAGWHCCGLRKSLAGSKRHHCCNKRELWELKSGVQTLFLVSWHCCGACKVGL